jgi:alcohol dehydrogenase
MALRAGAAYGKPFVIGHECTAEVVECGEEVRHLRKGQLAIVPWVMHPQLACVRGCR